MQSPEIGRRMLHSPMRCVRVLSYNAHHCPKQLTHLQIDLHLVHRRVTTQHFRDREKIDQQVHRSSRSSRPEYLIPKFPFPLNPTHTP
jgi:hypothetical protein